MLFKKLNVKDVKWSTKILLIKLKINKEAYAVRNAKIKEIIFTIEISFVDITKKVSINKQIIIE